MKKTSWPARLAAIVLGASAVLLPPAPTRAQPKPRDQGAAESARLATEADRLTAAGRYDEALALARRALALLERLGPDRPELVGALNRVAELYLAKEDGARAEPLLERAIAIADKSGMDASAVAASSFGDLGVVSLQRGDYQRAEPLLLRALAVAEKALGPEHRDVAVALNNVALLYQSKGEYPRAEPYYRRALAVAERSLGAESPDLAVSLNNLAELYRLEGELRLGEPLLLRALAIREKAFGPDHPAVAEALSNLSLLYQERGETRRAEPLAERDLAIVRKALGPDHPSVATSLNNLGLLHYHEGDYARAEPLLARALSIREATLGPRHPELAKSLVNQAMLYWATSDDARAKPLLARALSIEEAALGPHHPDLATTLTALGTLYYEERDYPRSASCYERALSIWEKLAPEHPGVARALGGLATIDWERGDPQSAEARYRRALAIFEKVSPEHPGAATIARDLSALFLSQGNAKEALRLKERAGAPQDRRMALLLAAGSERQRRAYLETLRGDTYATISLHMASMPTDAGAARLSLATILRRKGRLLDAMADSVAALRRHLERPDQALFDELASIDGRLAAQVFRGPQGAPLDLYRAGIGALEVERQRLEEAIGRRSSAFRAEQRPFSLADVEGALPQGTALLEISLYRPFDPSARRDARWGPPRYAAYLLRRGDLAWADLGEAAPIDAAVEQLRTALSSPTRDPRPVARALDEMVMAPLRGREDLGDTQTILLCPDGVLNLLPFGALIDEQGRYLIERYSFTYLTSGRDLLRLAAPAPPRQGAVVFADPTFGSTSAGPAGAAREARTVDLAMVRFPRLPGTAVEGRAVGRALAGATVLAGAEATEGAVKALHGPSVLHIATHGFFLPAEEERTGASPPEDRIAALEGAPAEAPIENPLLRAGLAFAGANGRASGADDGILTALEASGLDLAGTRLLVLSACETGLGEAHSGDGVYGLRRALVIAGAQTQLMSLWRVDDAATSELMAGFYEALNAGAGRSEALRRVELALLHRKDRSHPFYWASFIAIGQGTALDGGPGKPEVARLPPGPRGCACRQAGRAGDGREGLAAAACIGVALLARLARRRPRAAAAATS